MSARDLKSFAIVSAAVMWAAACTTVPQPVVPVEGSSGPLFDTVLDLDSKAFAAFNTCSAPEQLQKYGDYFAADVEFYHDTGGVTWNRKDMLANTEKYVCGNFKRELVPGSMRVYPIKDFGAIAQGTHKFCQFKSGACEGMAEFVIVWRKQGDTWRITRVLSYAHRPT